VAALQQNAGMRNLSATVRTRNCGPLFHDGAVTRPEVVAAQIERLLEALAATASCDVRDANVPPEIRPGTSAPQSLVSPPLRVRW
jgi:hypothetical protein